MAYLLLLICITLIGSVYLNRYLGRWHDRKIRDIRKRRVTAELQMRRQRKRLERLNEKLKEVEDTHKMYLDLVEKKERQKYVEPGDWLLNNRHITLNSYLQAKKYGDRNNKDIVDSCMILNFIDRKVARLAREAVAASQPDLVAPPNESGAVNDNG
ncbi:MAG: hypothetical protein ACNI3A_01895 [Desulfovibrio sp.]|uniref:hypothetical protein n=1 Tax=Desulfovibrio sp. 7SRBS1 TaxID=3378064 RepID=UPI003B3E810A